jgi:hypothetical protein
MLTPNLKASEKDKKTNLTINQSIEVEGTVLPAGSYVLKLVDLPSEHYLVRILNADENRVITTVFTTPVYRFEPADNSEFRFYGAESGRPPALHTWFYPGDSIGFEFREVQEPLQLKWCRAPAQQCQTGFHFQMNV